jgi:hypothetical protein
VVTGEVIVGWNGNDLDPAMGSFLQSRCSSPGTLRAASPLPQHGEAPERQDLVPAPVGRWNKAGGVNTPCVIMLFQRTGELLSV